MGRAARLRTVFATFGDSSQPTEIIEPRTSGTQDRKSVRSGEQAPTLDAGRHCKALNHNAGILQKVINIALRFTRGDAQQHQSTKFLWDCMYLCWNLGNLAPSAGYLLAENGYAPDRSRL
jgi:hypothetical protein